MSNYLENLGLEFMMDDECVNGFIGTVAQEGKGITGYYGLPYINKHFGDAQIILNTEFISEEEKKLDITAIDTHCRGRCVWEVRMTGMDLTSKKAPKTQKRFVVSRPAGGGMAVVNVVNADVLPSYASGELVKMQVIAFARDVNYFADEAAYEENETGEFKGRKLLIEEGHIFPTGMLMNRNPNSEDFEKNDWMDDHVLLRGTVKRIERGPVKIGEESFNSFFFVTIDTEYGELEIVHTADQIKEEHRENFRSGAMVHGVFVLSGDPAIYEYENGIVLDHEHDLALVRNTMMNGEAERLRSALSEAAVYTAGYNGKSYVGPDAIIDRFNYVNEDSKHRPNVYYATITEVDAGPDELPYPAGTRCIVLTVGDEDEFQSVCFVDVDDAGKISRIFTCPDTRYCFEYDEGQNFRKARFRDMLEPVSDSSELLNILDEHKAFATSELFVSDRSRFTEWMWVPRENQEKSSNGFFRERYYDTSDAALSRQGVTLSVTETSENRSVICARRFDGQTALQIVDFPVHTAQLYEALNEDILAMLPDQIDVKALRNPYTTSIKHHIGKIAGAYAILSFEIVYGNHQASLSIVGTPDTNCEALLNLLLHEYGITPKSSKSRVERFHREKKAEDMERDGASNDILLSHLKVLANCYETGDFTTLYPLLSESCVWESQWRIEPENGRSAVVMYYDSKGKQIRKSGAYPVCRIVRLGGNMNPVSVDQLHVNGETVENAKVSLFYTDGKPCLYMEQTIGRQTNGVIIDLRVDEEGMISRIDVCMPELFQFVPYE